MDIKQTKNIWIGIVVIALVAGAYYFGTSSKNSIESTQNTQDTTTSLITQEQPTKATEKADIASKSKCAADGKVFIQNYEQSNNYTSALGYRTVWGDTQYHFDTKLNTCLAYIWYVQEVNETHTGSIGSSDYTITIHSLVYNFVFDIYSNQAVLQSVNNRTTPWKGANVDTLVSSPNYQNVPNLEESVFFSQLKVLMNE